MIRSLFFFSAYVCLSLSVMLPQLILMLFVPQLAARLPLHYHRLCLKLLHIKVTVSGQITQESPCLYVSNHSSYLDIPVLGSLIQGCFIAKSEVATWPLFGFLAKLQRTLFIDRRRTCVKNGQHEMAKRLSAGDNLILFPEGTSNDGCHLLPFRRALFQTTLDYAYDGNLVIQPVTIQCIGMNGSAADRVAKQDYAWFGDMTLLPHLWRCFRLREIVVQVTFHPILSPKVWSNREMLTKHAENVVASAL